MPAAGVSRNWADDCQSLVSRRGYARYYSFTVDESMEVTIEVSSSADTYLYLRQGSAISGNALNENDDIESGNTNPRIVATLGPGTYNVATTGSFSLNISA